jgi:Tfp pilus assembly protein PilN
MINLLPPEHKESFRYAKLNNVLIRYVVLAFCFSLLLTIIVLAANYYVNKEKQKIIFEQSKRQLELQKRQEKKTNIDDYSARLNTIGKLYDSSIKFSELLEDIAVSLRPGVKMQQLALTGTATEPLSITLTSNTREAGLETRVTLEESKVFDHVDITSINYNSEANQYTFSVVASFASGEKK